MNEGNIPILLVSGKTLPETWEKSLLELWKSGINIPTQYDKPTDPSSRDSTMIMTVENPFEEPRIHKSFPGGLENLEIYRQEVVEGVHDYWIAPTQGKWTYTYHQRLFGYKPAWRDDDKEAMTFRCDTEDGTVDAGALNQIEFIINSLAAVPYSRRSFAITYMPSYDQNTTEPPCLQRVWCRCCNDADGNLVLNMNTHWRSRDAFKAAFMNMFALTDLMRYIAEGIQAKIGKPVKIGRYVDICDSYHIYGSYFNEFEGFLKSVKDRTFEERVWDSRDEMIQGSFEDGRGILQREKETGKIGMAR